MSEKPMGICDGVPNWLRRERTDMWVGVAPSSRRFLLRTLRVAPRFGWCLANIDTSLLGLVRRTSTILTCVQPSLYSALTDNQEEACSSDTLFFLRKHTQQKTKPPPPRLSFHSVCSPDPPLSRPLTLAIAPFLQGVWPAK
jgi:hypothetical protein